jgi:methylglutaconyl-CoA hydratase
MPGEDESLTSGTGTAILVIDRGPVREIRLRRPDLHNAFDEALIAELTRAFATVGTSSDGPSPRAVVLSAEGRSFCAGADVRYNLADSRRLAALFRTVRACPVLSIARVQGTALGGGCGLLAACDLVVAAETARFGFTEVRLGIVPATISPFVVERIGPSRARGLFASGEIFDAAEAQRIGLIDRLAPADRLDAEIERVLEAILIAAPLASREGKKLADRIGWRLASSDSAEDGARRSGTDPKSASPASLDPALGEETARLIAELRAKPEAREGLRAFLEKRKATWVEPPPSPRSDSV